jgi:probable rRNA maturation factor
MRLELIDNQDKLKLDLREFEDICKYISGKFDPDDKKTISIIFIDDEYMRKINRSYRNIDRTTDVLSFSYLEDPLGRGGSHVPYIIGEVYISPVTARENSRDQEGDWSFKMEIILLIIHGMLHIFGYDHQKDEERSVMYNIQDSLLHDISSKDWKGY